MLPHVALAAPQVALNSYHHTCCAYLNASSHNSFLNRQIGVKNACGGGVNSNRLFVKFVELKHDC